jgi:hypothetical protein
MTVFTRSVGYFPYDGLAVVSRYGVDVCVSGVKAVDETFGVYINRASVGVFQYLYGIGDNGVGA